MKRLPRMLALPVTLLLLGGCVIQTVSPAPTPTKPRLTPQQGLEKLNASGKVQVVFQGLTTGPENYRVAATTADIDSITMRLVTPSGVYGQVKQLSRWELSAPTVAVSFDGVPAGSVTLEVTAVDRNGSAIGKGQQQATVRARQTSIVNLVVDLAGSSTPGTPAAPATGNLQANITFTETQYATESLTGEWVVSLGAEPPAGPVTGCSDERHWYMYQQGEQVNGYTSGYNDAAHPTHANLYYTEIVTGTYRNGKLKLRGDVTYYDASGAPVGQIERVKYDVDYNPQTRHVVGTRNGQPGWAAPFLFDEGCASEPIPSGSARPRMTPPPTPRPTATPTPIMTPGATPTPAPSMTPPPGSVFDPSYPTRKFPPGQVKQVVDHIFSLYDHNFDRVLDYSLQADAEGVVIDESQRQEGTEEWSNGSQDGPVTYVTTFGIAHLLKAADRNQDKKVTEADLESFVTRFGPNAGLAIVPGFYDFYPEVILHVTRF